MENDATYQLCLSTTKKLLETGTITKADYRKMKDYLLLKYQPILPRLLG